MELSGKGGPPLAFCAHEVSMSMLMHGIVTRTYTLYKYAVETNYSVKLKLKLNNSRINKTVLTKITHLIFFNVQANIHTGDTIS